jgi:hypothetical protein
LHDSEHFRRLPQYLSDVIYILDFETLFDVEGLFAFLENTPGRYLSETIAAFERTKNHEPAELLKKVGELLNEHGVTFDDLHLQATERARLQKEKPENGDEDFEPELNYPELREAIAEMEEKLYPLMDERDYWDNVKKVISDNRD